MKILYYSNAMLRLPKTCWVWACTHEQINHPLFAQILAELLHTDLKFEQAKSIYLLHVYIRGITNV